MTPRVLLLALLAAAPAAALAAGPASQTSGATSFEDAKFSFAFSYDSSWIPSVQAEGESITFALSEGEVFISASRDPNTRHLKTRDAYADDQINSWKRREGLVFSKLERKETTLGNLPATKIEGTAKEYDEDYPFKLEQYVVERNGRLYVVKFSGLYDPSLPYWDGFQRMVRSFRFRDAGTTASAAPTATPRRKAPAATPAPTAAVVASPVSNVEAD